MATIMFEGYEVTYQEIAGHSWNEAKPTKVFSNFPIEYRLNEKVCGTCGAKMLKIKDVQHITSPLGRPSCYYQKELEIKDILE